MERRQPNGPKYETQAAETPHCKKALHLCPKPCNSLAGTDAYVPPSIATKSTLPPFPVIGHVVGRIFGTCQ
jgi:hypothetical protein